MILCACLDAHRQEGIPPGEESKPCPHRVSEGQQVTALFG